MVMVRGFYFLCLFLFVFVCFFFCQYDVLLEVRYILIPTSNPFGISVLKYERGENSLRRIFCLFLSLRSSDLRPAPFLAVVVVVPLTVVVA